VLLDWASSLRNQGVALMLLAERRKDAAMAETALNQINTAFQTCAMAAMRQTRCFLGTVAPLGTRCRRAAAWAVRLSALTSPILPCSNLSTARSKALGGAGGSLETGDAGYVGGVAGARAGSASLKTARDCCLFRKGRLHDPPPPLASTSKSSSLHSPDGRLAEGRLRIRAIEAPRVPAAQPP
jgi:hypothetical protein